MPIVDANGRQIETSATIYDSFAEWKLHTLDTSSLGAWNHQQLKIDLIRKDFAEAVLYSKEGLKEKILEQRKTIEELKKFCEDNLKIMSDLEIENTKLKGNLQ